jgi:GT2 family glycosyltransferase
VKQLRSWFNLRYRNDWMWSDGCQRPTLVLRDPIRPGWYMLSARLHCEQSRSYGLLNRIQGRILLNGRLRKRIIRIRKGSGFATFEILGLNGHADLSTLRLVPQPLWRVKRLLRRKLEKLHPAYQKSTWKQRSLAQQWRDYNHLLSRRSLPLVGYDEWIAKVEQSLLLDPQNQAGSSAMEKANDQLLTPMAIWMWGDRSNDQCCERSLQSLERQRPGGFHILPADQQLLDEDQHTWVVLLQVGDELAPQALSRMATVVQKHSGVGLIYADEDRISINGRRHTPQFKPAWNPDLLYSDPDYSHSWLIRADLCIQACQALHDDGQPVGLYSVVLEATARCSPDQILHIPEVLYHRLDRPEQQRASAETATALRSFFSRRGQALQVDVHPFGGHRLHWSLPDPAPLVSVIIPTRDREDLLRCCLNSLQQHAAGNPPTELILIDNGSHEPRTLAYLESLEHQPNIRVLRRPGLFNYAALNNEAVSLARGELVALLNNDVEAIHPGWLSEMAAQALRPEIGAVGAKLLFDDGTIQHGGILLGIGGVAGHAHKYVGADQDGYQLRLRLVHNVSAVTGAALVIRRRVFEEVQGFDADNLAVNYNDVDLCLRLMMAGYRNLFCPDAVLIHHESKSRGTPTEATAYAQWQAERKVMIERWGELLSSDPYYSPHLSLLEEDLSLSLKPAPTQARRCLPQQS